MVKMRYYQPLMTLLGAATITLVQQELTFALSNQEISAIAEQITVLIQSATPGSGIIIAKQGNTYSVLTAKHVIEDIFPGEEADVTTHDGQVYLIDTNNIKKFAEVDLAVVTFTSKKNYRLAKFGDSKQATPGTSAHSAGFPLPTGTLQISYQFTSGAITANASGLAEDGYGLSYDNYTLPGMSGGPVLNNSGEVIGVHGRADTVDPQATENPNVYLKSGFNLGIPIHTYISLLQPQQSLETQTKLALQADDFYLKGTKQARRDNYQGAIEAYSQAISLNPNYALAYLRRAEIYSEQRNFNGAVTDATKAIEIFDRSSQIDTAQHFRAYTFRNYLYSKVGNDQGIIADSSQGIAIYNNNFNISFFPNLIDEIRYYELHHLRGKAYFKTQNHEKALQDFQQVSKIFASFQSKEKFLEIIRLNHYRITSRYLEAYYFSGEAHFEAKNYPQAIENYNQILNQLDDMYLNFYDDKQKYKFWDLGDSYGLIAKSYKQSAIAYYNLGNKQKALATLQKAANFYNSSSTYLRQFYGDEYSQIQDLLYQYRN